jgi:hypothetical protein
LIVLPAKRNAPQMEDAGRLCAWRRFLLLIYAIGMISLGWWPWNVLLLAVLFRSHRKSAVDDRTHNSQSGLKDGACGKEMVGDEEVWLSRQLPKLSVITFADADAVSARWA